MAASGIQTNTTSHKKRKATAFHNILETTSWLLVLLVTITFEQKINTYFRTTRHTSQAPKEVEKWEIKPLNRYFPFSKSTVKSLEQVVKYVQSY